MSLVAALLPLWLLLPILVVPLALRSVLISEACNLSGGGRLCYQHRVQVPRLPPNVDEIIAHKKYDSCKTGDGPPKKPCVAAGCPECPNHAKKQKCGFKLGTHKFEDGKWNVVNSTQIEIESATDASPHARPARTTAGSIDHCQPEEFHRKALPEVSKRR